MNCYCCIYLVVYIIVSMMQGHTNKKFMYQLRLVFAVSSGFVMEHSHFVVYCTADAEKFLAARTEGNHVLVLVWYILRAIGTYKQVYYQLIAPIFDLKCTRTCLGYSL